jgi:Domain of unknown function (DUF4915)
MNLSKNGCARSAKTQNPGHRRPGVRGGVAFFREPLIRKLSARRVGYALRCVGLESGAEGHATQLSELATPGAHARCGLLIIDLRTGDSVHWVRVEGLVRELYDVAVLPHVTRPMALGFKTGEIERTIAIGTPGEL